jgi:S1-C subfamily serine protease
VTNGHVVGTDTSFQVFLAGSASPLPARLTGRYPPDDLALIQVTGAVRGARQAAGVRPCGSV